MRECLEARSAKERSKFSVVEHSTGLRLSREALHGLGKLMGQTALLTKVDAKIGLRPEPLAPKAKLTKDSKQQSKGTGKEGASTTGIVVALVRHEAF